MGSAAQTRAVQNYRKRLSKQGMARFEVVGLASDRELIRSLAQRLAENGPEAKEIRTVIDGKVRADKRRRGGVLAMLRCAPAAAAELNLTRNRVAPRKVDL
jgi:hypothetical protein